MKDANEESKDDNQLVGAAAKAARKAEEWKKHD